MNDIKIVIGTRINTLLAQHNYKQKELASYLNVTDNTISYFCCGKRMPSVEQIIKIAEFFEVSTDYLFGKSNVKSKDVTFKEACDFTGLNDYAMERLLEIKNKSVLAMDCINEALPYAISTMLCSINSYVCCFALDKILERKNVLEFIDDKKISIKMDANKINVRTSLGFSDVLRENEEAYEKFNFLESEKERRKIFDFEYLEYLVKLNFEQTMLRDRHWEFIVAKSYFDTLSIGNILKLFITDPYVDEKYKDIAKKVLNEGGWE